MSFDKNDLNKILSLSPEEFDKKLSGAIKASGIDEKISSSLLKDTKRVRSALAGLSEKDLENISEIIKKNNLGQIETIIKSEINRRG